LPLFVKEYFQWGKNPLNYPINYKDWGVFLIIDTAQFLPSRTSIGREILARTVQNKLTLQVPPSHKWGGGRESKAITINHSIVLDDLFFEGLGLGEGGKKKCLYFGNTSSELLLRFLEFADNKLGLKREMFKVTINSPSFNPNLRAKWSKILGIPVNNFSNVCFDSRINYEYAQLYLNSIILADLMKCLQGKLSAMVSTIEEYATPFLRGMFAAEGQVALRKTSSLHLTFSSVDLELVAFLKRCLLLLGISSGKYMFNGQFPIYGYRNLKRFRELNSHALHPDKREKFELGFAKYKRINVLNGEEARYLILKQLASGQKTCDDLAAVLGKARTTIQAHHIPILEREGKIKRTGKRGQAWLWVLSETKVTTLAAEAATEATPCANS